MKLITNILAIILLVLVLAAFFYGAHWCYVELNGAFS